MVSAKPLIRETLKDLGLAAAKSRGQNFLKDQNQIGRIIQAILEAAGENREMLEIGPGLGALTGPLLAAGARVLAVELDRGLAGNLSRLEREYPGRLTVLHRDVLTLGPEDLEPADQRYLCGNLPYNISSQVLFWFLDLRGHFSGATFMLQKEMAQRLCAPAGHKDYGRLAAALALWFRVDKVLDVPPSAFHPRPKVDSSVVTLRPRPAEELTDIEPALFSRFTAVAFAARRKTLFNNLARVYGREKSQAALAALELPPQVRAESLTPASLASLAKILASSTKDRPRPGH